MKNSEMNETMRIYESYSVMSDQQDPRLNRNVRDDEASQSMPFSSFMDQSTQDFTAKIPEDDDSGVTAIMPGRVPPMPPMPPVEETDETAKLPQQGMPPAENMNIEEA